VYDKLVEFFKRAFVEEKLDSLARGQLAGGVLFLHARSTSAFFGFLTALAEGVESRFRGFGLLFTH
jgi:hypothetical protein